LCGNNVEMESVPSSLRYWQDLTTSDFQALPPGRTIALLPLGATEQHGPHLPLSVDSDLVSGVIDASKPHLPHDLQVLVLPVQNVGYSPEHLAFPGTLSLSSATLLRVWTELAESVHRSGIHTLLMFNAHGGQAHAMDLVARDLRQRLGMLVVSANWYGLPLGAARSLFSDHEWRFGVHAGAVETSMMMALKPQQVRPEEFQDFPSTSEWRAQHCPVLGNGHSAKLAWMTHDLNPNGAVGNPLDATVEKGQALVQAAGASLAQLLTEMANLPPHTLRG